MYYLGVSSLVICFVLGMISLYKASTIHECPKVCQTYTMSIALILVVCALEFLVGDAVGEPGTFVETLAMSAYMLFTWRRMR